MLAKRNAVVYRAVATSAARWKGGMARAGRDATTEATGTTDTDFQKPRPDGLAHALGRVYISDAVAEEFGAENRRLNMLIPTAARSK